MTSLDSLDGATGYSLDHWGILGHQGVPLRLWQYSEDYYTCSLCCHTFTWFWSIHCWWSCILGEYCVEYLFILVNAFVDYLYFVYTLVMCTGTQSIDGHYVADRWVNVVLGGIHIVGTHEGQVSVCDCNCSILLFCRCTCRLSHLAIDMLTLFFTCLIVQKSCCGSFKLNLWGIASSCLVATCVGFVVDSSSFLQLSTQTWVSAPQYDQAWCTLTMFCAYVFALVFGCTLLHWFV